MNDLKTSDLARKTYEEHRRGTPYSAELGSLVGSLENAYRVQDELVGLLEKEYGPVVGYKVGLTSDAMQRMCGLEQPIRGSVLAGRVLSTGAVVSLSDFGRLGIEFEFALRIGATAPSPSVQHTASTVMSYVDGVAAAFELVDDRGADYTRLDVRGLVADNSWNAGVILSEFLPKASEVFGLVGLINLNGSLLDRGGAANVLGSPFASLAWLANDLSKVGRALRPGEIVMTGSIAQTRFPRSEDRWEFYVPDLGVVSMVAST